MNDILIQLCSWKSPNLLKSCIKSIEDNTDSDFSIVVTLNEADKESIDFLYENKTSFIVLYHNYGVPAVDCSLPFAHNHQYVLNTNDDMLFHKGWDKDLINIIKNNYPCSASCALVEPYGTNNPIVTVDNLGEVSELNTYKKFIENVKNNKYLKEDKIIGYSHPIMVTREDYLNVNGYSDNIDMGWYPGYGLDDYFAYRLWKKHKEKFKFIISNKSYVYHGISQTNKKLDYISKRRSGREYFTHKTGLTIEEFRDKINIFSKV